jgi:Lrp/AsnC family transcriptional regulator, leucine-responsive regulatory protein
MAIDKFDLAILVILQEDARASLQEISKRVGLSSTPCWTRIKRMESEGVIQGYTVKVDPLAIGLTDTVIVQVTLESHTDETLYAFGRALEEIPEVLEAYLVSGDYDYYIRIAVKDTRDYERLLRERLYRIPGIRHSKSSFVLRTLKESLLPLSTAPVSAITRQLKTAPRVAVAPAPAARPRAKAASSARRR